MGVLPGVQGRNSRAFSTGIIAFVGLGVILRLVAFLRQRSLWVDEARLALGIVERPFGQLLPPLPYDQNAPVLFLWGEKLLVQLFGTGETSLRLLPFVAGLTSVVLAYPLARRYLARTGTFLTVAMVAVSPALVYYSNEVKQYSVEAATTLILLLLASPSLAHPQSRRGRAQRWLFGAGLISVWLAASSVFLLAAILLAHAWSLRRRGDQRARWIWTAAAWAGSFLAAYVWVYSYAGQSPYMSRYWSPAFLGPASDGFLDRLTRILEETLWSGVLGRSTTQDPTMLARVIIGVLTAVLLLLPVLGVAGLRRRVGVSQVVLLAGPLAVLAGASLVGAYPLALRTTLFVLPIVFLLIGAGVEFVARALPRPLALLSSGGLLVLLIGVPGFWAVRDVADTNPAEHIRPLIAELRERRRPAEAVYIFAGSLPAWSFYTTDWSSADADRRSLIRRIADSRGPAFENAPSRGRRVDREGEALDYESPDGLELYGVPSGLERQALIGLVSTEPDRGWAENEAARIRRAARPRVWILMSHFFGPESALIRELDRLGGSPCLRRSKNSAALLCYDFPPLVGRAGGGAGV